MKTVLVKSVRLEGPASYDVRMLQITYVVGSIPTAHVVVATGYSLNTRKTVAFSAAGDLESKLWRIVVSTSESTTTVFMGYITTVTRGSSFNPLGSSLTYTLQMVGVHSRLGRYGGRSIQYFAPGNYAATLGHTATGCADVLPGDDVVDSAGWIAADAFGVLLPTVKRALWWIYGSCVKQNGADKPIPGTSTDALKADLDALLQEPNGLTIREEITALHSDAKIMLPVSLITWFTDKFAQQTVLDLLSNIFSPGYLMLELLPRLDHFEINGGIPWKKQPDITLSKNDILAIEDVTVLKTGKLVPEAVSVLVNSSSTTGEEVTSAIASYPPLAGGPDVRGGSVQMVTVPSWLLDLDKVNLGYGNKPDISANTTVKIKNQEKTPEGIASESFFSLGTLLAKAYFGMIRNRDKVISVTVPWFNLSYLQKVGYIMELTGIEQVPEGGLGSVFGRIQTVQLSMNMEPTKAACSLSISLSHVRSSDLNDKYALDAHPIWQGKSETKAAATTQARPGAIPSVSGTAGAAESGAGIAPSSGSDVKSRGAEEMSSSAKKSEKSKNNVVIDMSNYSPPAKTAAASASRGQKAMSKAAAYKQHMMETHSITHYGNTPSPVKNYGQALVPVTHSGCNPPPIKNYGQSPMPAIYSGRNPPSIKNSGRVPPPATHSGLAL